MYTDGQKKAKIGIVSVDIHGASYRLRFVYPEGERHQFTITKVSPEGWATAIRAAQLINRDIDLGDFDSTYVRYSPKHARTLKIAGEKASEGYSLADLWEMYKGANRDRVADSTQRKKWKVFDRILEETEPPLLSLKEADKFIGYLKKKYADGTLKALFSGTLTPCINLAVRLKKIPSNPYSDIRLGKKGKSLIECFEPSEVKRIIQAFLDDRFVPENSSYPHSYYAPMVQFLALTGCRPSEAHALTWKDVKAKEGRTLIRFNKAYTGGKLRKRTKNYVDRLFPCNDQLRELIEALPKRGGQDDLLFPSVTLGYINQDDWRRSYWLPVVEGLARRGDIDKYLKPYCLRHSFITRLIREGVDIATVASLVGNSPKTILQDYLASRQDFDLPEL